jgi:hypothetical protein
VKIQKTTRLLFSLVLSGMGLAAIAPGFSANPAQNLKLSQQGYGHASHPPVDDTQKACREIRENRQH